MDTLATALAGALIGALVVGFVIVARRRSRSPSALMHAVAAAAVGRAREAYGVELDFSPGSVERVEEILARLHEAARAGEPVDARREALTWGAYIGEVIIREKGGRWERDHSAGGPGSFPLLWGDHASFPIGWCGKRIENGEEDNVWVKYRALIAG